jgi:hypothetical protein
MPVHPGVSDHLFDHLTDRQCFSSSPLSIAGLKPVEAAVRIVGPLLFRHEERESVAVGERRPTRPKIVTGGRLRAPVQNDNQSRIGPKL